MWQKMLKEPRRAGTYLVCVAHRSVRTNMYTNHRIRWDASDWLIRMASLLATVNSSFILLNSTFWAVFLLRFFFVDFFMAFSSTIRSLEPFYFLGFTYKNWYLSNIWMLFAVNVTTRDEELDIILCWTWTHLFISQFNSKLE